jgi:hypothetical protein
VAHVEYSADRIEKYFPSVWQVLTESLGLSLFTSEEVVSRLEAEHRDTSEEIRVQVHLSDFYLNYT